LYIRASIYVFSVFNQNIFILNFPYTTMDELELEHLRQVLDYLPCTICEERTSEEERRYLCTVCARINRVVSAEKAIPKWKVEDGKIVAIEGMEIEELKPKIKVIERKVEKEEEVSEEEVEVLEIGEEIKEDELEIEEELPEWKAVDEPYKYGEYTLYTKEVMLRGKRKQRIYFFSKKQPEDATPCPLPEGYEVKVNEKTGLPLLKKRK